MNQGRFVCYAGYYPKKKLRGYWSWPFAELRIVDDSLSVYERFGRGFGREPALLAAAPIDDLEMLLFDAFPLVRQVRVSPVCATGSVAAMQGAQLIVSKRAFPNLIEQCRMDVSAPGEARPVNDACTAARGQGT